MPIFPYGLFNRKANQALVEALADLTQSAHVFEKGFAENKPELIEKIKQALLNGANPNIALPDKSSPALIGHSTRPLALAIRCTHPELVQLLLDFGASKTGVENTARMWLQHAVDITHVHPSQMEPTRKTKQDDAVKIGQMLIKHPFFTKALHDVTMFSYPYHAPQLLDESYIEKVLQILVDASSAPNLVNMQNMVMEPGSRMDDWEPIVRQCVFIKQSLGQRSELTTILAQQQQGQQAPPLIVRKRKL